MTASVAPLGATTPLLQANGLSKTYAGIRVLNGINLTLWPGQILALVGENGSGKSTIIKILSGAIRADEGGTVLLNGQRIELESPLDAERAEIVTVYQELSLFPFLSVTENLFYADFHRMKGRINWSELHRKAETFLRDFGVDLPVRKLVSTLSIADRQMLEIAKALHRRAKIMILDEPTAVLGGADVDRLLGMVKQLQRRGVAVIFVSHRLNEIFGLADSFLVLRDGQQIAAGHIDETNPDDLVSKMVGRHIATGFVRRDHDRDEELLRVEGLSTANSIALHDINLTLHKGEVLGIAGLRGAGRTELVRAIFGADPITSGRIFVHGKECRIGSPRAAIAHGLGLVPEDRGGQGLFRNLSSWQNMFMASDKSRWIDRRREKVAADNHVAKLQIKLPNLQTLVGALSGGNQQKVVLAKWLEAGIDVLLLDEPTRGIDVGSKAQIYALVRELCSNGMGVLLISSELPEVIENSDRILVMYKGAIAGELHQSQATEEAIIKYAVGGANIVKTQSNVDNSVAVRRGFVMPQFIRDYQVVIVLLIAMFVITLVAAPEFFNLANLSNVAREASVTGIVAIGMTFVILTGGIDLSVSAILALSGVCFAMMMGSGVSVPLALLLTAVLGAFIGALNGIGVTFFGIQAFIMTLATMAAANGAALLLCDGTPVSVDVDSPILDVLSNGNVLGIPGPVVVFAVGVVLAILVLRYLPFGRFVYGIGGSLEAARLSGVRTTRVLLLVYIVSGLCAALAGLVTTSRLFVGHPTAGGFVMLDSIAAVVIGGTSLMGGRGGMIGTVVGVLLLAMVANLLNLLGVSPFNQQIAKGVIIFVAVVFTTPGLRARFIQQWSAL